METKFTKGWSVVLPIECGYDPIVLTSDGFDPTDVQVFGEQAIAHAHLIAALPDLYEALERLVELTPGRANASTAEDLHLTVKAIAETVLARARGEQP